MKECCKKEENLNPSEPYGDGGLTFRRCKVCQCRHFNAVATGLGEKE